MWHPNKILVIRFSAIGDVVLTTPILRMLKNRYPETRIDFLVKSQFAELIETHPALHRVWTFDPQEGMEDLIGLLRHEKYEGVVDLQSSPRSRCFASRVQANRNVRFSPERFRRFLLVHFHLDCYREEEWVPIRYLKAIESWGVEDDGRGVELFVNPDAENSLEGKLKGLDSPGPILLLAPGAGRATKRWIPRRFGTVGNYFAQQGYQVILIGGEKDCPTGSEVGSFIPKLSADFSGRLSLQESLALIQKARILITNDTGVMHMASAVQTPVVAVFGPTTRQLGFYPFRATSKVMERDLDCRPCSYHGSQRCPKTHFRCMREIECRDVIEAAEELLNQESI